MKVAVDELDRWAKVLTSFQNAEKTPSRLADCEIMLGLVLVSARRYFSCKSEMFQAGLDTQEYDTSVADSIKGLREDVVYMYNVRYSEEGIVDTIKKFYLGSIV